MTDETGAAAPATEQAVTAPAVSEQATQAQTSAQESAAPENAETTEQETQEQSNSDEEKPQRLSRSQRMQRKVARLSTMLVEREAELQELRSKVTDGPAPPKEEDFNGDYFAYQRAVSKWDTEQAINTALSKVIPEPKKADARELNKEDIIEELRERITVAEELLPDFKQSLKSLQQTVGDLSDAVIEEIGESDKGEYILYHLSKNPRLAASINKMSARDAAREIARLESKVSLPQPKKQTQAPAPLNPLRGGAAPATDLNRLAKSDDATAYWAARQAQK